MARSRNHQYFLYITSYKQSVSLIRILLIHGNWYNDQAITYSHESPKNSLWLLIGSDEQTFVQGYLIKYRGIQDPTQKVLQGPENVSMLQTQSSTYPFHLNTSRAIAPCLFKTIHMQRHIYSPKCTHIDATFCF